MGDGDCQLSSLIFSHTALTSVAVVTGQNLHFEKYIVCFYLMTELSFYWKLLILWCRNQHPSDEISFLFHFIINLFIWNAERSVSESRTRLMNISEQQLFTMPVMLTYWHKMEWK